MATYNIQPLPETLSTDLNNLKLLSDAIQIERNLAETDVREGRVAMDECDRLMKRLKGEVEDIMGIKALPRRN